jgi:hypothetical protein
LAWKRSSVLWSALSSPQACTSSWTAITFRTFSPTGRSLAGYPRTAGSAGR